MMVFQVQVPGDSAIPGSWYRSLLRCAQDGELAILTLLYRNADSPILLQLLLQCITNAATTATNTPTGTTATNTQTGTTATNTLTGTTATATIATIATTATTATTSALLCESARLLAVCI